MKTGKKKQAWSSESESVYTSRIIERASARNRPMLRVFAGWLKTRGLAPSSITLRVGSASCFVDAVTAGMGMTCAQAFRSLTPAGVEDFFVRYGKDHGMAARRHMRCAMRLFLKFVASRSWVGGDLSDAVPPLLGYRLSNLPRGLGDEELSALLGLPWEKGKCARRDRAVVYLLATYGVRRQQVSTLRLSDIDWHDRTIDFAAHKGGKAVHHSLTQAVAQSLADYLRNERPISESNYVFLRQRRPHLQLGPKAVSALVRARMALCGLPPRGPHALRHAFATRLLRVGQTVKSIADLLGHRSLGAVAIYAKVDYARLLECAVDWPEVAP